jgi:transposase
LILPTETGTLDGTTIPEDDLVRKYIVALDDQEREALLALTTKGKVGARTLKRALVLLAADEGTLDQEIAAQVRVSGDTVARIRKRFVEEGLEAALRERPRPGKARKLDGRQEAYLIALTGSTPPAGRKRWTMQLLADQLVERQVVETLCDETVRRTLKRGTLNPGNITTGALPR